MSYETIRKSILALDVHFDDTEQNNNAILESISKLTNVLDSIAGNASQDESWWNAEEIKEYVFSDDVLDYVDGVSDSFKEDVREIQHSIVNYYA